jgi:hypothetical protein
MPWPPKEGELLPRYGEPVGIEQKLAGYSLNLDPEKPDAWAKANGFSKMIGIDLRSIDYLERQIRKGIALTPISLVEMREPDVAACTVEFRIAGTGRYSHRTAFLRTGWRVYGWNSRPLMTTAFLRDKKRRNI